MHPAASIKVLNGAAAGRLADGTGGAPVEPRARDDEERLDAGELVLRNNIFWNAAAAASFSTVNAPTTSCPTMCITNSNKPCDSFRITFPTNPSVAAITLETLPNR